MISAMPAVAIRRERRKQKSSSRASTPAGSTHSSTLSLSRSRNLVTAQRVNSIGQIDMILIAAGLVLLFFGIATSNTASLSVGLIFIGLGIILSIVKVVLKGTELAQSMGTSTPRTVQSTPVAVTPDIASTVSSEINHITLSEYNKAEGIYPGRKHFSLLLLQRRPIKHDAVSATNGNKPSIMITRSLDDIPGTRV